MFSVQHFTEEQKKKLFESVLSFSKDQQSVIDSVNLKQITAFGIQNMRVINSEANSQMKMSKSKIFIEDADRKQKRKADVQLGNLAKKQKLIQVKVLNFINIGRSLCDPTMSLLCFCITIANDRCSNFHEEVEINGLIDDEGAMKIFVCSRHAALCADEDKLHHQYVQINRCLSEYRKAIEAPAREPAPVAHHPRMPASAADHPDPVVRGMKAVRDVFGSATHPNAASSAEMAPDLNLLDEESASEEEVEVSEEEAEPSQMDVDQEGSNAEDSVNSDDVASSMHNFTIQEKK
jgi:hypothetical protein